jgi:hypothetical protein
MKSHLKLLLALAFAVFVSNHAFSAETEQTSSQFEPPKPELAFIGRFSVELTAPIWELGKTSDAGKRRVVPIVGGTFKGPLVNGKILNNGADWQVVTADGMTEIDTRYLVQMDDGALVYVQTKGLRYGPADVMADVAKGKQVDPRKYYFRMYITFETSSEKYAWLNRTVGVVSAMRLGTAVVSDAYAVK